MVFPDGMSEAQKIAEHDAAFANAERDECHCGHPLGGSDHCPACGCEQFERACFQQFTPSCGCVVCEFKRETEPETF